MLEKELVQSFCLYILRTKMKVSIKQLYRFIKNLEILSMQKMLGQTIGYSLKGNTASLFLSLVNKEILKEKLRGMKSFIF